MAVGGQSGYGSIVLLRTVLWKCVSGRATTLPASLNHKETLLPHPRRRQLGISYQLRRLRSRPLNPRIQTRLAMPLDVVAATEPIIQPDLCAASQHSVDANCRVSPCAV